MVISTLLRVSMLKLVKHIRLNIIVEVQTINFGSKLTINVSPSNNLKVSSCRSSKLMACNIHG